KRRGPRARTQSVASACSFTRPRTPSRCGPARRHRFPRCPRPRCRRWSTDAGERISRCRHRGGRAGRRCRNATGDARHRRNGDGSTLGRALVASVGAWGALLVLHLVSPAGMGFGDVRLALLIGLDLGWLGTSEVVLGIFAGFLFAAVIGLLLIATRRRGRSDA